MRQAAGAGGTRPRIELERMAHPTRAELSVGVIAQQRRIVRVDLEQSFVLRPRLVAVSDPEQAQSPRGRRHELKRIQVDCPVEEIDSSGRIGFLLEAAQPIERERALRVELECPPEVLPRLAPSLLAGHEPGQLRHTAERDPGLARPRVELECATGGRLGIRKHRPCVTHDVIAPQERERKRLACVRARECWIDRRGLIEQPYGRLHVFQPPLA